MHTAKFLENIVNAKLTPYLFGALGWMIAWQIQLLIQQLLVYLTEEAIFDKIKIRIEVECLQGCSGKQLLEGMVVIFCILKINTIGQFEFRF
jgi:hypothetical protein